MEYKRFENTIILRMDRGEEILETLKTVALKENIKLASVSAIGACDHFVAGVYSIPEQKYYKNEFNGVFEITALVGNINTMNGEYYAHLHITCADEKCNCLGGHLNEARVSATCEMVINIIEGNVDRVKNPDTGINVFKF